MAWFGNLVERIRNAAQGQEMREGPDPLLRAQQGRQGDRLHRELYLDDVNRLGAERAEYIHRARADGLVNYYREDGQRLEAQAQAEQQPAQEALDRLERTYGLEDQADEDDPELEQDTAQSVGNEAYWNARDGGYNYDSATAIADQAERDWERAQGQTEPERIAQVHAVEGWPYVERTRGDREPGPQEADQSGDLVTDPAELDRLVDEFAQEFREVSDPEIEQAQINQDAAENWSGTYPHYEGPGYTEPPADWEGWHEPHDEHTKEHYWDDPENHTLPPEPGQPEIGEWLSGGESPASYEMDEAELGPRAADALDGENRAGLGPDLDATRSEAAPQEMEAAS